MTTAASGPRSFDPYVGQEKIVKNLRVFIQVARERGGSLSHVLLFGPRLSKTILGHHHRQREGLRCQRPTGTRSPERQRLGQVPDNSIISKDRCDRTLLMKEDETHRVLLRSRSSSPVRSLWPPLGSSRGWSTRSTTASPRLAARASTLGSSGSSTPPGASAIESDFAEPSTSISVALGANQRGSDETRQVQVAEFSFVLQRRAAENPAGR